MKVLDSIKRTLESLEASRSQKSEGCEEFAEVFEKHSDIPKEKLVEIIADIKAAHCKHELPAVETEEENVPAEDNKEDEVITEEDNKVEVTGSTQDVSGDAGHTDANKEDKERIAELDASEDDSTADSTPEDFYTEENDEEVDDELILSEEDEEVDDELILSEEDEEGDIVETPVEDEVVDDEVVEEDEDFDVYKDELDIAEDDEEMVGLDDEEIIEEDEEELDCVDGDCEMHESAHKNEANTGAKAAMANTFDGEKAFSSDVDALTEYLTDI